MAMVIHGSLQAEFMETKHNDHIHRCGTPIFGNIVAGVHMDNDIAIQWHWHMVRLDTQALNTRRQIQSVK